MAVDWSTAPEFGRTACVKFTLQRLVQSFPSVSPQIVEIGTSCGYSLSGLGNVILAFSWFAANYGGQVKSFDPDSGAIAFAKSILVKYGRPDNCLDYCEFFKESGWAIGKKISTPVHLIYLDADISVGGAQHYNVCNEPNNDKNEWYLELHNRAQHLFTKSSLILIDDTSKNPYKGKGAALVPFLLDEGLWEEVKGFPGDYGMVLLEKVK